MADPGVMYNWEKYTLFKTDTRETDVTAMEFLEGPAVTD
jgi:hypothetical protein